MEIEELRGKISALDKCSKLLDQKFVSLVKNSEKCNHILEIISDNIQGEDDNNRQVWVPKKCVQRIKSQNFKTDIVSLTVLLAFIVIVIKQ